MADDGAGVSAEVVVVRLELVQLLEHGEQMPTPAIDGRRMREHGEPLAAQVGRLLLTELAPLINAHMGVIYQTESADSPQLRLLSAYAGDGANPHPLVVQFGEGLIGQGAGDHFRVAGVWAADRTDRPKWVAAAAMTCLPDG